MTKPSVRETIGGVPLGLSRDYDHLPRTGPLRQVCCQLCLRVYEDAERLTADGCHVLAVMCVRCREKGRLKWIEARRVKLEVPKATVVLFRRRRSQGDSVNLCTWWSRLYVHFRWHVYPRRRYVACCQDCAAPTGFCLACAEILEHNRETGAYS